MVSNKVFVIFVRYKMSDMKFFKRLFPHKALPERTMVPDEIIRHYPEPQKDLESIIQLVPSTCEVLYQHIWHSYIPKDWKFWAMDLMENGFESYGVIELAGMDLNQDDAGLNYLVEKVLMELGVPVDQEVFNSAYIMSVARDVLLGNRTAKNGFDLLSSTAIKTNYCQTFMDFYYWLDSADEARYSTYGDHGLRYDNTEEWMYQFFEKLVKANPKYCPMPEHWCNCTTI